MKKLLLLTLMLCLAVPLLAQDQEMNKPETDMASMAPPPPISDDFMKWMVGDWEGTSVTPMGNSNDMQNCWFGLDDQFLMIDYKSGWDGGEYHGMGAMTITQSGEVAGYWIDNTRNMSKGTGKREGNVVTMEWEGKMGKMTRIMEKVSDDKFTVVAKFTGPDGSMMESKSEMTRKATMTEKK